jgi:hypothetical protein
LNVERWQQHNPPLDKPMVIVNHKNITVYRFDKNGKIVEVKRG